MSSNPAAPHIARWDLDKTYLRTEFDTVRDLVKTALERADQKRSHPGAAAVLREMQASGVEIHVLSGSPEQMRRRLAAKLRLDGIKFASLTLKPNLQNFLRLRWRSIKGQLGYKLPALLGMRAGVEPSVHETLVGDDAEADAFIYALYADACAGIADASTVEAVMRRDRCHPEEIEEAMLAMRRIHRDVPVVDRILIHLDRQTPPGDFAVFGERLVPFYNYFQAALVLHEDGRITADAVLRVGTDLVLQHRFDGDALVRSFLDLARRGNLKGTRFDDLLDALDRWPRVGSDASGPPSGRITGEGPRGAFGLDEVLAIARRKDELRRAVSIERETSNASPDWIALVDAHNRRRR
jgi:hypothetical protein